MHGLHCPTWVCHLGPFTSFSSFSRVRLAGCKSGSACSHNSYLRRRLVWPSPKQQKGDRGSWWGLSPGPVIPKASSVPGLPFVMWSKRSTPTHTHIHILFLKKAGLRWFFVICNQSVDEFSNSDSFLSLTQQLLTSSPGDTQWSSIQPGSWKVPGVRRMDASKRHCGGNNRGQRLWLPVSKQGTKAEPFLLVGPKHSYRSLPHTHTCLPQAGCCPHIILRITPTATVIFIPGIPTDSLYPKTYYYHFKL